MEIEYYSDTKELKENLKVIEEEECPSRPGEEGIDRGQPYDWSFRLRRNIPTADFNFWI